MAIHSIKINGIKNPVGFDYSYLNLSYLSDKKERGIPRLVLSAKGKPVYEQTLDYAQSFCTPLSFVPEKETRYYVKIVWDKAECEQAFFETGTDFDCPFITSEKGISHPVFIKCFSSKGTVKSARLYITGVGLYEAELNGKKVGNEYLTPYCNDYDAYLQYQTYDITDMLQKENCIRVTLGNGWYKGRFGLKSKENIYGNTFALAAKLVLNYKNGEKEVITTDESWTAESSSILDSGIYDGEVRDDTAKITTCHVKIYQKKFNVVPRCSLPVVEKYRLSPTLIESPKGEKILDFGQNFAGTVCFRSRLKRGQRVRLAAGEILQDGCFFRDNLRTAKAEFVYTSDGVDKEILPKFTFYGFRYILLEGFDEVKPTDFAGVVLFSDLEETVKISTNNAKMNRLLANCVWGQRSNFLDVPTDCPQRDERLGWTGDAEVFSSTACYQMDCRAFYAKYLKDIEVDTNLYGTVKTYSPSFKEGESAFSVWGDAATIIPWNIYRFYGDKQLLEKHFPMMEKYVMKLIADDDAHGSNRLYNFGFHLGDWLSQDGTSPNSLKGATDEYFIASAYYYNSVKIVSEAAYALGYSEKYNYYKEEALWIKRAILHEYFSPSGKLAIDTQTAYVICATFGIYRSKKALKEGFAKRLKSDQYKIRGGFVGATQMIQALISIGLTEDAFRMLYSEIYPSWLHCVNLGATTIWERWNSVEEDGKMSGTGMNSLNHYSYGAVAEAFYAYIAGLRSLSPGFKKTVIEPKFNYRLQKLNYSYDSPSGKYVINYNRGEGREMLLHIEIPFGASCELKLEGEKNRRLQGGVYEIKYIPSVEMIEPYSIDTPVCSLLSESKPADVIKKYVPILYHFLSTQDIGLNGESLRYIAMRESFRVPDEILNLINKDLQEIKTTI